MRDEAVAGWAGISFPSHGKWAARTARGCRGGSARASAGRVEGAAARNIGRIRAQQFFLATHLCLAILGRMARKLRVEFGRESYIAAHK
jgi:hypothetical protein